ncbi:2-succinyl-5-enolpyruvyl-6-hydroxy-3-cyclohexene-1-carboxylic-acid synthase [Halovivax sp.]|uniref:2-succinyl-5-enolpyruvyl-6-hydroxy-3- cyclohexene-1-carboxylic-acid synthase n=1 Tax=Halovivax sp. TaxID=1935978 RepID=UPI0025C6813B|nr:2-succinyl-5-enolpyruvyl-6-hydroxy-3-cyclohexene-1-carboxylic-acid synthase [Halovivax sp.]
MTAPNRNALWGRTIVDELAAGGLEAVCIAPGSRSTPLTVAFAAHPAVDVFSHLDERSGAYFALGRARRTGRPTALVCTSGTAAANFHPAVIEADRGRVPLVVLTADRPPELRDSGANQTVDQRDLYGDAVRWNVDLPEPRIDERTLRSLRTTAARALATATGTPAGPVHLNCPFAKPLEPTAVPGDVPADFEETLAGRGRDGPFVTTAIGRPGVEEATAERVADALEGARRPLFVGGPADPEEVATGEREWRRILAELAEAIGAPLLADPLSGFRFGTPADSATICAGYDAYVGDPVPDPDVVVRFGASPTSKALRHYLRDADATQFVVDPSGGWREAEFTATDLVVSDPAALVGSVADAIVPAEARASVDDAWIDRYREAESIVDEVVADATTPDALADDPFEGGVLATVFAEAADPATVFVSNSMPIRDADRFVRPRTADVTALGNRGASGIDGIVSSALGAGSAVDDALTLVTGDLALYHDANGLLAVERCDVDATIVAIHNDGGGIFHQLPVESFDPPFTDQFKTPHGLDFAPLADLYEFEYETVAPEAFPDAYASSVAASGTTILAVEFDAADSHRRRAELEENVRRRLGADP